jgi:ribonuclease III
MSARTAALEKRLGHAFVRADLLTEALTHPSYLQDHPQSGPHNQRLEFLGDAVLHFLLTEALFLAAPAEREGVLSRRRAVLTKGKFLSQLARDLGLDKAVRLGRSEDDSGGRNRDSILEDAMEAVIGALFLDTGIAETRRLVLGWYGPLAARLDGVEQVENPKGRLQELVQPEHGNDALRYTVDATTGPRHARQFTVSVHLRDRLLGTGHGTSKKAAEEAAARAAMLAL